LFDPVDVSMLNHAVAHTSPSVISGSSRHGHWQQFAVIHGKLRRWVC
jgi:hypothetical protein